MICKKCNTQKEQEEFYHRDSTCKECRKEMVRLNRLKKADYYREYDKKRYIHDPKVKERHRKYAETDAGKQSANKAKRKFIQQNPVKRAAHVILGNAVRDGRVEKKYNCEECGEYSGRIHGHHSDYARPLEVTWLCPSCHTDWHRKNGEALNG